MYTQSSLFDETPFPLRETPPEATQIDAGLERRLLHGLARQWETESWVLPARARAAIRPPLFALMDAQALLGQWHRERRLVSLNRRHAAGDPWPRVRDTLLHEMAHQVADELLGGDETPHGPVFGEACRLLRLDPRVRAARAGPVAEETDARATERVRKLLALAGSANRHEAEAAMCKAHVLMLRHQVGALQSDLPGAYESLCLGAPRLRHGRAEYRLAALLCEFYFVQAIWVGAYVVEAGKMGRVLEIAGTPANVRMAEYIHAFVGRYITDAWARFPSRAAARRTARDDFGAGIVEGFAARLRATVAAAPAADRALVRTGDPALLDYFRFRHPHIRHARAGAGRRDHGAYARGQALGRNLLVHRPVTAGAAVRGHLLPSTGTGAA